jgi:segregation and condensation protein B
LIEENNSKDIRCAIEAMLFMSPRSIKLSKIKKEFPNTDAEIITLSILELIKDYEKKNSAIEVVFDNNKIEMVLKPRYLKYCKFAISKVLTTGELKTLAIVSLNSPVNQSKIVKQRPYDHIKILKDLDLIKVTKNGRKNVLSTTKKFDILYNKKINI